MIWNSIKTTMLLAGLAGLFMGFGYLIGSTIGLIIGFAIAMAINFGSYWFSDKIVLKMHKAKEVSKDHKLYQMVEELARKAKIPMPKVYIIQAPSPNAFATGRSPKHAAVAATESLMSILTEEELKGVMAHELSHVKHRDTLIQTIAVAIASAIAMVAEMFQWMAIFGFGGNDDDGMPGLIGLIALAILTPIIATIIQLAISRQREYMADAGAVRLMRTPMPLINALQKLESAATHTKKPHASAAPAESLYIVNPFRKSALFKLFSTHPQTKDRVAAMKKVKIVR